MYSYDLTDILSLCSVLVCKIQSVVMSYRNIINVNCCDDCSIWAIQFTVCFFLDGELYFLVH
jgi:hypothetical protein